MNAYKIRIVFSELMGDRFTSLIDLDVCCKEDVLLKKLDKLTKMIGEFIEENKKTAKINDR